MSLTSSIVYAIQEPNGSTLVQEKHVDQAGKAYPHFYTAAAGADIDANLAAYAVTLQDALADKEAEEIING